MPLLHSYRVVGCVSPARLPNDLENIRFQGVQSAMKTGNGVFAFIDNSPLFSS